MFNNPFAFSPDQRILQITFFFLIFKIVLQQQQQNLICFYSQSRVMVFCTKPKLRTQGLIPSVALGLLQGCGNA